MIATHRFPVPHLHAISRTLLMQAGTPHPIADEVSAILIGANLAGHDSHGVLRIPTYLQQIAEGKLDPAAEPKVVEEDATTLRIDGMNGFGHYTARRAMALAIEKARTSKISCVTFTRVQHIGRLGEYAEDAARAGCLGIVTVGNGSRTVGRTSPHGGARAVLGTNPIAIGVPTGDDTPFVLDFATSIVAQGKVQVAKSKGLDMPPGHLLDSDGYPTTKIEDFENGGSLVPFGGHKGYALSLFICLLGGLGTTFDPERAAMGGCYMQVLNIDAFTPLAAYQQNVRTFLDAIKETPVAPDAAEVLVPGDFEQRNRRERLAAGIEVPETIVGQLQQWAARLQVPFDESTNEEQDRARYATME
ncbi:MAG: Ldh family oxidoreductase [Caldilineaceae bacterium]|nr:Ldh family oxidoreductase [Caldilineaceae bacterium]